MTAFDRIERRLPELLEELAPVSLPDYFDDMLQATAQSRQRPAWSSLERWLPMGVIARPLPNRPIPWRMIAVVAALGILLAATLVYVGSQRRVPAPFGPAANGALVVGTEDGDIVTVDPVTGATTTLISGPTFDGGPYFSPNGQRLVFDRKASAAAGVEATTLFVANADGSDAHEFLAVTSFDWFEWAADSDHAIVSGGAGTERSISIIDVDKGSRVDLALGIDVGYAMPRPNSDQLLLTAGDEANRTFWLVNADGSGLIQLQTAGHANNEPVISSDGSRIAYTTWTAGAEGRLHVFDITTKKDRELGSASDGFVWQHPQFSPDGTRLVAERYLEGSDPPVAQIAVIEVDGTGPSTAMGPLTGNPPPSVAFSPDGTKILVTYADGVVRTFDPDGRNEQVQSWSAPAGLSWQRKAR